MSKKRMQRPWKIGSDYLVIGAAGMKRTVTLTAKGKTCHGREILIFEPRRKAGKLGSDRPPRAWVWQSEAWGS